MDNHVYKKVEIVGTAETSIDDAIRNGIQRAAKTLKNVDWFEVGEVRGNVQGGKVAQFQVVLKVGFRLEE
ncbi:dodecin [Azospirillum canadense]|uniref:dodecin n=1 Tax=Azospirillum canadense TaxID=403962 RepID=UPI0022280047|nr:dodecin [Azospirillum canadense]MCW2236023.1 flavin-binding protein dodecin [Azospirillum canadense]